ncbi:MAG: hypothetical protein QM831_32735 [Kofleriaceae bacterium]
MKLVLGMLVLAACDQGIIGQPMSQSGGDDGVSDAGGISAARNDFEIVVAPLLQTCKTCHDGTDAVHLDYNSLIAIGMSSGRWQSSDITAYLQVDRSQHSPTIPEWTPDNATSVNGWLQMEGHDR